MYKNKVESWKILSIIFIALLLISSAVWAGPDDTVKVGVRYDPSTASMIQMKLGNDIPVILPMHEALMASDPVTGDRIPSLAKSIEVLESGKTLRIVMKEGSIFHTGDPVTADDVKFTYEQCVNPANGNLMAGLLDEIEKITVIDDHTLTFQFWEPYAPWKELMWVGICSKKYFERVGPEEFNKKPVGSGPFQFVEHKIGESLTLKAANNHYAGTVDFGTLSFLVIPDDMSRLAMLETGELDLVYEIMPHQLRRLEKNKKIKIKSTNKVPSLIGISIRPAIEPLMKNAKFKYAMNYAINRQEMVDKIFLGKGYPLYMYASVAELGYDPDIQWDFNPEKAKVFLSESGYAPGTPLTISYAADIPNSSLVAASIQKYLKDIGVTIRLQKLDVGTMATYAKKQDKRYGAMGMYTWGGARDPSIRMQLTLHSKGLYASYPNRYNKDELDRLITAQGREMNAEKRKELLAKIHKIWVDDPGSIVLFGLDLIYAMRSKIEYNWTPNEVYPNNFQNIKIIK
ncbi:MAG: ABC transporter substrate-binding protein [Proteobacteria bacterium]|nr:ABC transporter substrate-binding protein [Pseudomonadota bacterium]MBU1388310.1 ABC transporter substrate-binding protein [Pseudomonadota bacterium]MBU1542873.1 ABC transporter substrate-binding protein [Pseudomonadota bacterium]MBU2430859.1 ABC transporter substrate-binding protein [Pseudomonadota bacterium]MBU2483078.1 ABC transporter substrate-binding protein [Pseudomonadota bacterium]